MPGNDKHIPTLEEFFVCHGILSRQPRKVFPFHRRIFRAITQWVCGKLPNGKRNLAICMPPRHGKTFIARDLVAWGLMCFPDSEWIYTSYSASLAIAQTVVIKETCASDWYRKAAPYVGVESGKGRQDYFRTALGGAVYGVGTEGSLTGFGAGKTRPEFGGGIVIDDPLAAIDALTVRREKCNNWYSQALYSRRNSTNTPVLLIMQRLHEQDLVGYVWQREPELWEILQIPVRDDEGQVLWPEKFSVDEAERLERLDPFAFSAQYMQEPTPAGGAMFKREMIQRYDVRPDNLVRVGIFADTAMKEGQRNDYSVLHYMGTDGANCYCLDMDRGKWTAPDLLEHATKFWERHKPRRMVNPVRFTGFFIEDKASGTGLIQTLRARWGPRTGEARAVVKITKLDALVTEIKTAHGVQIATRRFVGHEKLFACRELGRRAIVALSGIQAPNWAYGKTNGKTNGEGNTMEVMEVENRRLTGWKEIEKYVGLHKETIVRHGYPVHKAPGGKSSTVFAFTKELLEHGLTMDTLKN